MSGRWKPEIGDSYCFIDSCIDVDYERHDGHSWDEERFAAGNCFKTAAEAEAAAEKVKALLLSLHYNETSTANSETLKGTFTEYLKKYAEQQSDRILQKAKERRLSEQYHNGSKKTTLPEWVEIGGYVYDARNGYGKIVSGSVKSCYIEFDGGAGDFVPEAFRDFKQARLRPYNAEEMKALVGKPITMLDGAVCLCTVYSKRDESVILESIHWDAQELLRSGYTLNGKPCGVLEHLNENGEWVK